ncbi:hypothetical protein H6F77_09980 [Microcoleus sp. FACHB-831]|uniref:hypothetical protein n=1 Tax=Microcoleus sp. FACHB-831 TaxID=2692827 RepID=UPI0016845A7A|nr:hypothetical protein [Microcoleus sp. FACHB-831]MBD1921417.1 hypothetical protein [Microcoleus sp. FACHB-831]
MNLVPVVEFRPTEYQTKHHEMPENSKANSLELWDAYWRNSLADSGIITLEPYANGSWLVETEILLNNKKTIELMLIKHLTNFKSGLIKSISEEVGALYGGYILEIDEKLKIYPECCGSLKDIQEWKDISEWEDSQETTLWIGHPWLMVSAIDEEYLQFRRTAEYREPPKPVIFQVKKSDLKLAIRIAEDNLFKFQEVIWPILRNIIPKNAEEVLKILVYGSEP